MPPRRPKDKGTDAERAVARWFQNNGHPHAERRASNGSTDRGDITGVPGVVIEVKSRKRPVSDAQIEAWMDETERERANAGADIGILVVRRPGVGDGNAGRWWAYTTAHVLTRVIDPGGSDYDEAPDFTVRMTLESLARGLRWAGYGDPLPEVPDGA